MAEKLVYALQTLGWDEQLVGAWGKLGTASECLGLSTILLFTCP